jgi:EmrB/QacA subfamily drug resistance transporter
MTRTASSRIPRPGILAALAVAEFVLTLDLSIVNVALPAIRADLAFAADALPWVVNGYALTFAGFLLLGGRAADLLGGRRVFSAALALFSLASLACALAPAPKALIAARAAQGLGAGVLAPVTLSILTGIYDEPEQRRRALSIWTAAAIGGGAVGGLIGGVLTAALSWRWIFLVNVPIGAALLAYAIAHLPRRPAPAGRHRLDVAGAVTATAGLTALVWALVRIETLGWDAAEVVAGLAVAVLLLAAFALVETRLASAPLLPFSVFAVRPVAAGNLLAFLSFIPVMATWYLLSIWLQSDRGYPPARTGLWLLPMSLAVVGGSQASFRLLARVDARLVFAAGGLLGAAGLAWLGVLPARTPIVWVIVAATVAMAGGGLTFAPITMAATAGVPPEQGGLAGGLLNTTRQIGGVLGLAVLGTLAATGAGAAGGFTVGAVVLAGTALVGALILPARLVTPRQHPQGASAGVVEVSQSTSEGGR